MAEQTLCNNCKQRPATEIWVGDGGVLAYAHGAYQHWCLRCVLEAQLEHARKLATSIPELESKLAKGVT